MHLRRNCGEAKLKQLPGMPNIRAKMGGFFGDEAFFCFWFVILFVLFFCFVFFTFWFCCWSDLVLVCLLCLLVIFVERNDFAEQVDAGC